MTVSKLEAQSVTILIKNDEVKRSISKLQWLDTPIVDFSTKNSHFRDCFKIGSSDC